MKNFGFYMNNCNEKTWLTNNSETAIFNHTKNYINENTGLQFEQMNAHTNKPWSYKLIFLSHTSCLKNNNN